MIHAASLVERADQLGTLEEAVAGAFDSGKVVLVSGEAGFGKSSLLRVLVDGLDHRYRVLLASCDPLVIPSAFAPLFDLLDELPDHLVEAIRSRSGRHPVAAEMLRMLKQDRMVLILEDMHWADEATLGLARYLGRRIASTGSCLILTYRSEEVDLAHPLRLVLADIGSAAVRIELPPLTLEGVESMAKGTDMDPVSVHEATLGNPFFVDELLRQPTLTLPPTIGDVVLAAVSRLPEGAHEILYLAALSPDGIPRRVLGDPAAEIDRYVDVAIQRGLLILTRGRLICRHDLIREALLRAIPPSLEQALHRRLLSFLEETAPASPDLATLAYHSIGAGEPEKAVRYSLRAGREAATSGAHRQAAFHLAHAVDFKESMTEAELAGALLEAAQEQCLINEFASAGELARRRISMFDTPPERARARAWFAYFQARENDLGACLREAKLAVGVLRSEPPSEELALALGVLAWAELVEGHLTEAIVHGDEAVDAARTAGSRRVEVYAATTAGTARSLLHDPMGRAQVEEAARVGVANGLGEFAARALNNLGIIELELGHLAAARERYDRTIEYASAHELDAWYIAAVATRAAINLESGRWTEADRDLAVVLGQRTCAQTEVESMLVAATLKCRRGDPGSTEMIQEVLARVEGSTDHFAVVSGCALALEGAWIGLVPSADAKARYEALRNSDVLAQDHGGRGTVAFWARRLGLPQPEGALLGPAGLEWRGAVSEAAQMWAQQGYVVQAAVTRAVEPDADLEGVFVELRGLEAQGVVRGLRRELQRRGVKHIPRGKRPSTLQNPARLTRRQVEVLDLMVSGHSNAEIAAQLFISQKTASHHVSAILTKLNVSSRLQAAALATANGWAAPISPGLNS